MAPSAQYDELPWNKGEKEMHSLLHVSHYDNPTSLFLSPFAANLLMWSPLLAVGTLDDQGRPWTSIWGGPPGFSRPVAENVIGVRTNVDRTYDPVFEKLFGKDGKDATGQVVKPEQETMVGGLAIDLETRRRVKLYGKMVAGIVSPKEKDVGEVQLAIHIEQSLGNCPKYLNKKHIVPITPEPTLAADSLPLPSDALDLIGKSDLFFISSSDHDTDMDTNHRGGPPGFVRVTSNEHNECIIVYPEYSGNRLYQTLGNLRTTPRAGLVFPDFDTGDVLYVTGTTAILIGEQANEVLPHSNLAVQITVEALRYVKKGLGFKGIQGELSPYNPPVRLLKSEQRNMIPSVGKTRTAVVMKKEILGPTIARYRFRIEDLSPTNKGVMTWKGGQYVALSFEDELSQGYSHMRDDDPASLNDDYLRTFTVSSPPSNDSEFEVTLRTHGPVTKFLYRLNSRTHLEVPLPGFGGEFFITQGQNERAVYIAGGVGITPLLAQASSLDLSNLELFWAVRGEDLNFIKDTFTRIPGLQRPTTKLFITGKIARAGLDELNEMGVQVERRRIEESDVKDVPNTVHFCASKPLTKNLLKWLEGKKLVYEDFGY